MSSAKDKSQETARRYARWMAAVSRDADQVAFIHLFDHFAPRVHAYLLRLGMDRANAEEITQDVMLTMWQKASLFDPEKSSVGTWLFRIARNRRIDSARRDNARRIDENDPMLSPAPAFMQDDTLDSATRAHHVSKALATLPGEQIALLRLAFFDGLSHSEISEKTGLPLGTVKSRIRLAFAKLRQALERRGIDADA